MNGFLISLSTVLALLASIVRLLLVSNYQTTTAVAIASGAGPLPTLVGSLLPVVQVTVPVLTVILLLLSFLFRRRSSGRTFFIVGLCTLGATFLITPTTLSWADIGTKAEEIFGFFWPFVLLMVQILFWIVVAAITTVLVVIVVRTDWQNWRNWDIKKWRNWKDWHLVGIAGLALPAMGTFAALLVAIVGTLIAATVTWVTFFPLETEVARLPDRARSMWLPAEEVGMKKGGQPTVGYVLGTSDGWMTLLREPDRTVAKIPMNEVKSRTICRFAAPNPMPLVPLPGASVPNIHECRK